MFDIFFFLWFGLVVSLSYLGLFGENALAMAFGRIIHPRGNLRNEALRLDC